jgi:hypothetical protein
MATLIHSGNALVGGLIYARAGIIRFLASPLHKVSAIKFPTSSGSSRGRKKLLADLMPVNIFVVTAEGWMQEIRMNFE